ncbi:hypothetical protein Fmac_003015 [Flemingia macrophylla]|uniref:NAB domain-containing protein n=1 Tax=Flemingia macrophylla TaxID=520843 RepID=A0ABD1NLL2_9FABA
MLQRAASNAYSWWWVSHIRTKQSKWMEQNLQDMEEKVQTVMKLLEEEGDSFAKRAEMYYKRRPELISFVEESFKAYRALAERYDHISTELQNANNTIATVFPDRVPLMDEDDDDASPRPQRKKPEGSKKNIPKPPLKDLKTAITTAKATKKFQYKKSAAAAAPKVPKSGLSKKEAREEVQKLQKKILALQTVKEFVKSSYDNSLSRYWEAEEQIKELQEKVSTLQDEIGEGVLIEDDDARHLMAETALKSCQEALTELQEKQERSLDETRIEAKRVKDVKAKLSSLMDEFHYDQSNSKEPRIQGDLKEIAETKDLEKNANELTKKKQELQLLKENMKEHFETSSNPSLSVAEMADKIDGLVNKVISLENAVSSQTAMVKRLRTETNELQEQIWTLENDKESLIKDKNKLNNQLRETEEKLHRVQDLNQIVDDQNGNLKNQFTEAHCNLDHLSEEVKNVQTEVEAKTTDLSQLQKDSSTQDESKCESQGQVILNQDNLLNDINSEKELTAELVDKELKVAGTVEDDVTSDKKTEVTDSPSANESNVIDSLENDDKSINTVKVKATSTSEMEEATPVKDKSTKELEEQEKTVTPSNGDEKATVSMSTTTENDLASNKADSSSESFEKQQENDAEQSPCEIENALKVDHKKQGTAQEDEPDWRKLFTNGMQDREQVLLTEYTNTLRSYKDVKKRLAEIEKKNQDGNFDSSLQLKELKTANAMKDEEIRLLRQKLGILQRSLDGNEDLPESPAVLPSEKHDIEKLLKVEPPESTASPVEEKFRSKMDEILEQNLTFWLKFSAYFSEVQKFETTIKDLQIELSKIEERGMSADGNTNIKFAIKSDAKPIYKHLTEIQTQITIWMEKGALLKDELQRRFSSLCDIQEEITAALKTSAEDDDFRFTSYQAAKFQGEILNMKQENNKVADELQSGLDIVTSLQLDVEKALVKLNDEFGFSASKRQQNGQLRQSENRAKVPLRSFIFGAKPKKQSIFSCMTPGMHRKFKVAKEHSHM